MKTYHVWAEGYRANGDRANAHLIGSIESDSFENACNTLIRICGMDDHNWDKEKLTYWGCRLFDNEIDARKTFG